MPETTPSPREELKHNRLMAGLEIVEAEAPPSEPPPADATVEHALAPIQAVWDGAEGGTPPMRALPVRTVIDKPPRRLPLVLPGLVVLALLAAFVSWVSAAPLWLTVGHAVEGTVTVKACDATGCHGVFTPADGQHATAVRVTGDQEAKQVGHSSQAQVTSSRATTAYTGDRAGLWWRVGIGLGLLVGLGFAVAAVTGAWRWHGRARLAAVLASLTAPLALFAAVFALTW
ncbi:hypothetical protein [Stackebrandtia nassauensis]|uniref:Uncharacterized protein n=1 Tax=Stackebrandtia nassauensis (strain DSM 44728 / CIP 108903 / NRRL B-16338 / NBRC 102104 / LLR-40K-21) TaxID=446470 RepID=D3PY15_STANL|nr:hypothetical protein [Stackebrandtia nassauensis]ADD45344.1 hypothetical protein Snas_5714 [Stackebrandtia nassauensis DSM 44728]